MKHTSLSVAVFLLAGFTLATQRQAQALEAVTAASAVAAVSVQENEANEAAQEDAAQAAREAETRKPVFVYIVGTLELKAEEQRDAKGVVGILHAKDQDYQLKIFYPELIEKLAKFDGKRVKLRGNPRNKGKYFLTLDAGRAYATDK